MGYLFNFNQFFNAKKYTPEASYTVRGNVNWCNHRGEQYGGYSKH